MCENIKLDKDTLIVSFLPQNPVVVLKLSQLF